MTPDKTHAATIKFGLGNIMKANMQPGWKLSARLQPHVGTDFCQAGEIGVLMQGKIHVVCNDGFEETISAGSAYRVAQGMMHWLQEMSLHSASSFQLQKKSLQLGQRVEALRSYLIK